MRRIILFITIMFIFVGCGTKISLKEYKDISSVNIISNDGIKFKKPTISNNTIHITSDNSNYNTYFNITKRLLLERFSKRNYFDIKQVQSNYTININIASLDTLKRYHRARFIETKKGGYYTEPFWTYNVSVVMSAKMIDDNGKYSYFTSRESVRMSGETKYSIPASIYIDVINNAVMNLVNKIAQEITPDATIISQKVHIEDKEDKIFLINMGIDYGLRQNQRVKVYKPTIEKNEITSGTMMSRIFIGWGRVSDQVLMNESWIVLDDEDNNNIINIGDKVEIIYSHY